MQKLENNILNFLLQYNIQEKFKIILAGFSGGADSTSLLFALNNVIKNNKLNIKIIALHLNHNQRGVESDNDEKFCLDFSKNLNIDFYSHKLKSNKKLSELEAREQRYNFFKTMALECNTNALFLAHNKDDNIETFFYRTLKGTSTYGLKCILPFRKDENLQIFRPLLNTNRVDIEEYLKFHKLTYVNDKTNFQSFFLRNYIRNKMTKHFLYINHNYQNAVSNLIRTINDNEDFLDKVLNDSLKKIILNCDETFPKYKTTNFLELDKAIKNRLIAQLLKENKIDWNYKKIDEICYFIQKNSTLKNGKIMSISNNLFLFSNNSYFYLLKKENKSDECCYINDFEKIYTFENYKIFFKKLEKIPNIFPKENENCAIVSFDEVTSPFCIRYRQNGDVIKPFGFSEGSMKLKKYFINRGVLKHNRDKIVLLAKDNEILWAKNVGLSDKLKVYKHSKKIYEIVIEKV